MPMDFLMENILLVSLVATSALALIFPPLFRSGSAELDPGKATLMINREDAVVIDVRDVGEFAAGHLPDAHHFPAAKIGERLEDLEKFKEKPLIVCCASGMRSGKVCSTLKKAGFARVHALAGGVDAWVSAGLPVKKGNRNK